MTAEGYDHHYEPAEVHEFRRVGIDTEAVVAPGTQKLLLVLWLLRTRDLDERES